MVLGLESGRHGSLRSARVKELEAEKQGQGGATWGKVNEFSWRICRIWILGTVRRHVVNIDDMDESTWEFFLILRCIS